MTELNGAQKGKRPDLAERNRSRHEHPIFPFGEDAEIKHCTKCCEDKPFAEFYKDKGNKSDGYRNTCKVCHRKASNVSYFKDHEANKAKKSQRMAARAAENYARIVELKSAPCTDCGGTFPPVCMDFDHLEGADKIAHVARMIWQCPWEKIAAEIAKCELVCSNCHRIRTFTRGQSWHTDVARIALGRVI